MRRLEDLLDADRVAAWLGATLMSDDPITVTMTVRPEHANSHGSTHGGVVFALADVALSLLSNRDTTAFAIGAHMSFTGRSMPGDRLTVVISESAAQRTVASYRAEVSSGGRPIATFAGTVYRPHR